MLGVQGAGSRVQGSGFRVQGLRAMFRVQGRSSRVRVDCSGLRTEGTGKGHPQGLRTLEGDRVEGGPHPCMSEIGDTFVLKHTPSPQLRSMHDPAKLTFVVRPPKSVHV